MSSNNNNGSGEKFATRINEIKQNFEKYYSICMRELGEPVTDHQFWSSIFFLMKLKQEWQSLSVAIVKEAEETGPVSRRTRDWTKELQKNLDDVLASVEISETSVLAWSSPERLKEEAERTDRALSWLSDKLL